MISVRGVTRAAIVAVVCVSLVSAASAAVDIQTVPVGNLGNAGEWSGQSYGGYGPDRICGAVAYTYNIGKFEVTAGQYKEFLNAVGGVDTYALYNTYMSNTEYGSGIARSGGGTVGNPFTYTVDANFVNRPVNYVSWGDSARFANWLHNGQPTGAQGLSTTEDGAYYLNGATSDAQLIAVSREVDWKWAITSEDEWYKAAYHKNDGVTGNYWDYPTSSNTAPGRDMADASGNNANYWPAPYAYPIDSGKYTTVAGEFENSDSPYGTFDQGGNVWEWNEALISESYRGLRGGSFWYNDNYLRAAYRYSHDYYFPSNEDSNIGFRVSEVPEPATMGLLALGGLGMLMRRRSVRG
jgi:formylglycine-generating enzyme required for sulfatase activity